MDANNQIPLTVTRTVCARIPTPEGEFQLCTFENNRDVKDHLAIVMGEVQGKADVLVRVHSECFTGDLLGSQRCDCGEQLHLAMRQIAHEGEGMILYLRQEGRGIGLPDKLRAYNLQDIGYDTVDANLMLGHQADERDYTIAARILEDFDVCSIRLLTNNPEKIDQLEKAGIKVTERVPVEPTFQAENAEYLFTKARRMRHLLPIETVEMAARGHGTD